MNSNIKDTFDSYKEIDSISNKRNIPAQIVKAYINLYSFLHEKINDETVIPKLSDSEIIETWISNRNWLMIPPKGCSDKDDALKSPYPNIWVYITDDLENMGSGLHWAQANSVDNFLNLLNVLNYKNLEKLKGAFSTLKKDYTIITQKKTHKKGLAIAAPSDFEEVKSWSLKGFNPNIANEILKSVEEIRVEGQQLRESGQVEWCVPTVQVEYNEFKANNYELLLEIVMDYIKIVKVCHETLTQSQIRKIKHNLEKDFDYEKLKTKYEQLKFFLKFNKITNEDFTKRVKELNEMIKNYNLINNSNLDLLEES